MCWQTNAFLLGYDHVVPAPEADHVRRPDEPAPEYPVRGRTDREYAEASDVVAPVAPQHVRNREAPPRTSQLA